MAKTERVTENLVRKALQANGYHGEGTHILVEEQKSAILAVQKALASASKSGGGGNGAPEFIISNPDNPDILVVVECKADTKEHESPLVSKILANDETGQDAADAAKRVQRFAVDGALHYARFLSREYNVIAIGVSGQSASGMKFNAYIHTKGGKFPKNLVAPEGAGFSNFVPWSDFVRAATFDPAVRLLRFNDLMAFSRTLHDFMREHGKLTEEQKPLLVSGTLIALRNQPFANSFHLYKPNDLQKAWFDTIQGEFTAASIPKAKITNMVQPYSSLFVHPELSKATRALPKGPLHEIIKMLNEKVWPFFGIYREFDIVGQFYGEFLKYTGGDGKGLGIVLTPRHITELFALLANVNKDSKVLDLCAGTGGFLISAMHEMGRSSVTEADHRHIKEKGLIGVEQQPHMFALAASNMILRGDGKANLHQGSCFDPGIEAAVRGHQCDVGMLNPPYSQKDTDLHELVFVKQMLDCLAPAGTGLALIPINNAISPHPMREEILKSHTLEAVMSLPNDLFYPVGVVPCVMIFTAHRPHAYSKRKTWFGYWRDDGHIKVKHLGRVDTRHRWHVIRDRWISSFRNREVIPGESITVDVTAADEWCAEAYLETDYSTITRADFEREVKRYAAFRIMNSLGGGDDEDGSA